MFKKISKTLFAVAGFSLCLSVAHAEGMDNCKVQVAVSTPPVELNQNVSFNVIVDTVVSKSLTLRGGNAPQFIDKLPCSNNPVVISATQYSTPSNDLSAFQVIGQCVLKSGPVYLPATGNSVSVVFPNDFICNQ